MSGTKTYRELSKREKIKERKDILNRLADAEEKHAEKFKEWLLVRTGRENALKRLEEAVESVRKV